MAAVPSVHRPRRQAAPPDSTAAALVTDSVADAVECARLATLAGLPVVAAESARWGFTNRTTLVTLVDGRRIAVQLLAGREVARRRLRVGARLAERLAVAGVPTAPLLGGDAGAATPFALHDFVEGCNGAESLATTGGAVRLARLMGALVPRLAAVDARGLRLPSTWADPARLAVAAQRWFERAEPHLEAATSRALRAAIASLETLFLGRRPAFAHGDFAPVNVLVTSGAGPRTGTVTALLDLEFARLADPLFDVAWWGWIVRFHHPDRWPAVWPEFLAAAGGPDASAAFSDRVRVLQLLRLLELLDRAGRRAAATWAARLAVTARW